MNVDSLKSELQQVLDNDVVLRKEFNELKRSLSDYRNQLIMRDEDCKRLQVTIDVLNTKLVVMERDNTNYKAELASFKELRGSIKEQLQAKQDEIEARVDEIKLIRAELNDLAEKHQAELEAIQNQSSIELAKVREEYEERIAGLKSASAERELALRNEFENQLATTGSSVAEKEAFLLEQHQQELQSLRTNFENQMNTLTAQYNAQLEGMSSASQNELQIVRNGFVAEINDLKAQFEVDMLSMESSYKATISSLEEELRTQQSGLSASYEAQIESIQIEAAEQVKNLEASLGARIQELELELANQSNGSDLRVSDAVEAVKNEYESLLASKLAEHELRINEITSEYEAKISNTVIHSTAQNSKLTEDFIKLQSELDQLLANNREMASNLDVKNSEYALLELRLLASESQLNDGTLKFQQLLAEYDNYKQQTALSSSEQVNLLNVEIEAIQSAHKEVVYGLELTIGELRQEIQNMTGVFEGMTNSLAEAERNLEFKHQELERKTEEFDGVLSRLIATENLVNEQNEGHQAEIDRLLAEFEQKEIQAGRAYEELLIENKGVIGEIESSQLKIESQESELQILRSELEEMRVKDAEKSEAFRDLISERNFKITNLEATSAALREELAQLKAENETIRVQLASQSQIETAHLVANEQLQLVAEENSQLQAKVNEFESAVAFMNERIQSIEGELAVKNDQIDQHNKAYGEVLADLEALSAERMSLLGEKEEMAIQLLKMNEVIGQISHQVESSQIDVTDLNNHRKNVILAGNSGGNEDRSAMKKQINELVREIDKCISLLSA